MEISGKETLGLSPGWADRIDLSTTNGGAGTLLFDPNDITIVDGTGGGIGSPVMADTIADQDIINFLNNGTLWSGNCYKSGKIHASIPNHFIEIGNEISIEKFIYK